MEVPVWLRDDQQPLGSLSFERQRRRGRGAAKKNSVVLKKESVNRNIVPSRRS